MSDRSLQPNVRGESPGNYHKGEVSGIGNPGEGLNWRGGENVSGLEISAETHPFSGERGNKQLLPSQLTSQELSFDRPFVPEDNLLFDSDRTKLEAEDNDTIEKIWVSEATGIIRGNKGNPYSEEEDYQRLRATYQKKRFGKGH